MSRIAVVSQVPPPHHGSTMVTAFLLDLLRERHDVELIDRRYSRTVADVGRGSLRKIVALPSLVARTVATVARRRPDAAIVFLTNRRLSFYSDALVVGVLRAARVPVIHYVHTSGYAELAASDRVTGPLVRRVLRAASSVVPLGDSMRADVEWAGLAEPAVPIVNVPPEAPPPGTGARGRRVCFLSNLIPDKGAHRAIEIGERLCEDDAAVTVAIAGAPSDPDYLSRLESRLATSPHRVRITLLGPVYGEDKWRLLAESAVLLFPSTYALEAQPLTILEAVSVGTRVVGFDIGGLADLAAASPLVTLVPAGDTDAATRATSAALDAPAADAQGREAWDRERERYRDQWEDRIAAVVGPRAPEPAGRA